MVSLTSFAGPKWLEFQAIKLDFTAIERALLAFG